MELDSCSRPTASDGFGVSDAVHGHGLITPPVVPNYRLEECLMPDDYGAAGRGMHEHGM